jgi:hypothetical protein
VFWRSLSQSHVGTNFGYEFIVHEVAIVCRHIKVTETPSPMLLIIFPRTYVYVVSPYGTMSLTYYYKKIPIKIL